MGEAGVAELVDALRSGRSRCMPVGVQIPPSAPRCNILCLTQNVTSWLILL